MFRARAGPLQEDGGFALAELRLKQLAVRTEAVVLHFAIERVGTGGAVRGLHDKQQPLARRAQVSQPPALHHPAAMHAAAREQHIEPVAPEFLEDGPHRRS